MNRNSVVVGILVLAASLVGQAQEEKNCKYVVKQVSFEHSSRLTEQQLTTLRTRAIGKCYDELDTGSISNDVYRQLRSWGYRKPTVYDPSKFRVLNSAITPSPVSIAIDFRLSGTDNR